MKGWNMTLRDASCSAREFRGGIVLQANGSGSSLGADQEAARLRELGEYLRRTREFRGVTLEQAVEATKVRNRYLQAIEQGDVRVLPGIVYARGFVRSYADFLGLDGNKLAAQYLGPVASEDSPTSGASPSGRQGSVRNPSTESERRTSSSGGRRAARLRGRRSGSVFSRALGATALGLAVFTIAVLFYSSLAKHVASPAGGVSAVTPKSPAVASGPTKGTTGQAKSQPNTPPAKQSTKTVSLTSLGSSQYTSNFQVTATAPLVLKVTGISGRCWIQVYADGRNIVPSAFVTQGQVQMFRAVNSLSIDAGASRNISMTINGLPVPLVASALGGYTYSFERK